MTPLDRMLAPRGDVDRLRRTLARDYRLLEVRRDGGQADWCPVSGTEPFDWDAPLPLAGAKRFLFPPRETLLRWQGDAIAAAVPDAPALALFGVRACDVAAIAYQDRFFARDPWYARRRERVLIVAVNCVAACPGGFCADVDAGPFAHAGFDLGLTPLADDGMAIEVGTARGQGVLVSAGVATRALEGAALEAAERRARESFPARPFVARAIGRLDAKTIADDEWQALGPACFACTGCTSLCPTCSCFTVVDEARDGGGERTRQWDSCLLEGFQREASGHHPSPRPGDRVRRFWYHKLSADFVARAGRLGCVGCGRCDVTCPGSIGALRVLAAVGAR
jgi:formate hydrogenlyase subunit 6/NADH:ubiquinone oxidoreductase subunit I